MKKILAQAACLILICFYLFLPFPLSARQFDVVADNAANTANFTLKKDASSPLSQSFGLFPLIRAMFNGGEQGIPPFVRVRNKNVYFYSLPSAANPLFALIPTYYLKVIGAEGAFWKVEVLEQGNYHTKLTGYVLANTVESIFTVPVLPLYPQEKVKVETTGAKIFPSPAISSQYIMALKGQSMGYFGKIITTDREWYYVYYFNTVGYVDAAEVSTPAIADHPTPLSAEDPAEIIDEPDPKPSPQEDFPFNSLQLALILLITIPSVIIIIIMLTPSKKFQNKKPVTYNYVEGQALQEAPQALSGENKPKYYDDYI